MKLTTIGEHTFCPDLLTGGIAIDIGCLGFEFSNGLKQLGCEVHAFDLEDLEAPAGIYFARAAITHEDKQIFVVNKPDRQAWHVADKGLIPINSISLNKLYGFFEHAQRSIDIVKIDAEGSEYQILSDPNFRAVPRMFSIEFHMHCHMDLHSKYYVKCIHNLLQHYQPVQHQLSVAHGSGLNYWDSLFIRKDLL